ncbi:hypothetical protein CJ030_MR2G024049 [Morella rubra]|uniref:Transmembrane protein n=1 Tax=Morella rubra TaxID=262757 RepID=A0A6A1W8R7_9ROSI|nr:hypothetical protein CJ030_MR2G024049 [Morella rubra]
MVKKKKLVIALAWLLVMACAILSANPTAAAPLHKFEHIIRPQAGIHSPRSSFFLSVLTTCITAPSDFLKVVAAAGSFGSQQSAAEQHVVARDVLALDAS